MQKSSDVLDEALTAARELKRCRRNYKNILEQITEIVGMIGGKEIKAESNGDLSTLDGRRLSPFPSQDEILKVVRDLDLAKERGRVIRGALPNGVQIDGLERLN